MNHQSRFSENSSEPAQEISNQIRQWWQNKDHSQLSQDELTQLIQALSGPPAIWDSIPEDNPYNSMEAWCEGELGCNADTFLDEVASLVGEQAVSSLRDRRLSAIFRPLTD